MIGGMGRIRGRTIAVLGLLALVVAALLIWHRPLLSLFADRAQVQEFVTRFGPWAPLATILLHVAQVLLAPIPGQVIDVVNGYLFGTAWGTVYSLVGVISGSSLAMALARRFGRPWAERLIKRETLERLDSYSRQRGGLFFFLVFLFPFLPDDVACFLAGLTPLPLPELVVLATVCRLPGIFVANFVGANAAALTRTQGAVFIAVLAAIAVAFWRYQERVEVVMLKATAWLSDKLKASGKMTMRVIGLDLTTSPKRGTAFAVLTTEMDIVAKGFVTDNEQIIALAEEQRSTLIAIDAPLNLPMGLCCLEESCTCRPASSRKGRRCERELSALGISSYYTTKRSIIKGMVYRAIALKEKLEGRGFVVIEVYPYASRVCLFGRLPRKTTVTGRRALQESLHHLIPAIPSPQESLLSHDVLDALLAAYTGILYIREQTEALGDPAEGLLHIPISGCSVE